MRAAFHVFALVTAAALIVGEACAAETLPVLYADDFEHGMDRWQSLDADAAEPSFKVVEIEGPKGKSTFALRALGTSQYQPPFRSPQNFVLLKDMTVGDFELTAHVQSTNVDAGAHRDMCILWGYQSPSRYYYVHFGAAADPNACQIFIVNDAARRPITMKTAQGTPWTTGWHKVRVVRRVGDGAIEAYFDDMEEPLMTAHDNTFTWGRVGLGTFDDNGNWDDFELRGAVVKPDKGEEPESDPGRESRE